MIQFMPHIRSAIARGWMLVAMAVGSIMIVAMSSWLNAAALAGSAALEQHMANATERYQQELDRAHANALAAQSLLPDIQLASRRFASLAQQERATGALTGTSGSGTVAQLLTQMSTELNRLATEVEESRNAVKRTYAAGGRHLARMRALVSNSGAVSARANAFGEETLKLIGEITALQQTSVAPSVKRTAADLGKTFIAPIADSRDADLASRQTEIVSRVETALKASSRQLAEAAQEILDRPVVKPSRFEPLSAPEAVLRYSGDFVPSWAGAISIDLLPAVLILIMVVVEGAIRREDGGELDAETMSAADVMRGAALYQQMQAQFATDGRGAALTSGAAGNGGVQPPNPPEPINEERLPASADVRDTAATSTPLSDKIRPIAS